MGKAKAILLVVAIGLVGAWAGQKVGDGVLTIVGLAVAILGPFVLPSFGTMSRARFQGGAFLILLIMAVLGMAGVAAGIIK